MAAADEIIELSEQARRLERIVQESSDERVLDVSELLTKVASEIEGQYEPVAITIDAPDLLEYRGKPTLRVALEELLENAAKHTGDSPEIRVGVAESADDIEIRITDAGEGLPDQELAVLEGRSETRLVHSSGLGLWLVNTIISNHNGDISVDVTDGGTTISLALPRQNVTDPKDIEAEALQEEFDKFKRIFDEAVAAMFIVGEDGRIIEVNERASSLLDRSEESLVGEFIDSFFAPDAVQETVDDLLTDQSSTLKVVDANGTEYLVDYSVTAEIVPEQHLIVGQDVTEQRDRKRTLEQLTHRLEFALEATDAIVWDWDIGADEVTYYPSEKELFGTSIDTREEFFDVIHPDDRQDVMNTLEDALDTGETKQEEARIVVDGEVRWIDAPGKPIMEDGEPERMVGIVRDITEQKAKDRQFERTADLLATTEQIAGVGGWEIDPVTEEIFWTENLFDLLGVEAETEPPLEEALDLYHEEDRPIVAEAIESALETGNSFDIEARLIRPDGELRRLRIQGVPKVEEGEVVRLRGIVEDIT